MAQSKGHTGNPNGRPKGTPNKATMEMRQWLSMLIDKNRSRIEKDIKSLEPKDRLAILEKFMQYTTPKMQSIDASVDLRTLSDSQLDSVINELSNRISE